MIYELKIHSKRHTEFIDISNEIQEIISKSSINNGVCYIFIPHTTAGVTINENADPTVVEDMLNQLNKVIPLDDDYKHLEGNSAAHIKASLMGFSENLMIHENKMRLGTWQGIYFTEFDGPRNRKAYVKIVSD